MAYYQAGNGGDPGGGVQGDGQQGGGGEQFYQPVKFETAAMPTCENIGEGFVRFHEEPNVWRVNNLLIC